MVTTVGPLVGCIVVGFKVGFLVVGIWVVGFWVGFVDVGLEVG
jgi:hypothetical protein